MRQNWKFLAVIVFLVSSAGSASFAAVVTLKNFSTKPVVFSDGGGPNHDQPITVQPGKNQIAIIGKSVKACQYGSGSVNDCWTKDINWKTWIAQEDGSCTLTNPLYGFTLAIENCSPTNVLVLYEKKGNESIAKWTVEKGTTQMIRVFGALESSYYLQEEAPVAVTSTIPSKKTKRKKVSQSSIQSIFALHEKKWTFNNGKFLAPRDLMIDATVTVENKTKNLMHFRMQRSRKTIATVQPGATQTITFSGLASQLFNLNPEDVAKSGVGDMPSQGFRPSGLNGRTLVARADGSFFLKVKKQVLQ